MTSLKGYLTARRVALAIVGFNGAIIIIGLVFSVKNSVEFVSLNGGLLVMWPIFSVLYGLMGVLILTRQPRHVVGWLFMIVSFMAAVSTLASGLPDLESEEFSPALAVIGESIWIMALVIPMTLVLQFFPNGRLLSRRWWPLPIATILWIAILAGSFSADDTGIDDSGGLSIFLGYLNNIILPTVIIGSLAAVVVRFLRSTAIERAQMKWLVYTSVLGVLIGTLILLSLGDDDLIVSIYFTSLPTMIALAVGIAILRYRLYDIDIIIRRTLQYGIVTGILLLVYFSLVVFFQALFANVGNQQSEILIVVSTLIIAGLFNPLRLRVQKVVDRRFYRRKYDAEQALARFSAVARDEVDLEKLTAALLDVVEETMQPVSANLSLMSDKINK